MVGSSPVAVPWTLDFAPVSSKEFLDIQATVESGFTLKRVCDMTRTYSIIIYFFQIKKKLGYPKIMIVVNSPNH